MLWFILGLILFVVVCILINHNAWLEVGEGIILFFIVVVLSSLAFFISSAIATDNADLEFETISETKIIALKDNQNADGGIFLCGGYVEEELYYYYAKETELGYKTDKIWAENCYIKYTDGEAYIEEQKAKFTNEFVKIIAVPLCSGRYIIHCPEDTVTTEFKVDLE